MATDVATMPTVEISNGDRNELDCELFREYPGGEVTPSIDHALADSVTDCSSRICFLSFSRPGFKNMMGGGLCQHKRRFMALSVICLLDGITVFIYCKK